MAVQLDLITSRNMSEVLQNPELFIYYNDFFISPGKPVNTTGQPEWEPWLPSGQVYFSGMKMEQYSNTTKCQSLATRPETLY